MDPTKKIDSSSERGSLGNRTFNILRDKILNEEYGTGEKLNEVILAKELAISRTPIREALKQLELEGLVRSVPNKGVYVIGFSPRDIDDMFEIRAALEGLAIELAIDRISEEQIDEIKDIFELMEFYTAKNDQKKISALNVQFHDTIYRSTCSQYFSQLLKDVTYYVSVTSRHSISRPERLETALTEHKAIYEAIVNKDKVAAKQTIETHIRTTQMLVRKYYKSKQQ